MFQISKIVDTYLKWIENEEKETSKLNKDDKILALSNIEKCKIIHKRMQKGIELLESNDNAFRAFQLANTAIYLQMFQNHGILINKKMVLKRLKGLIILNIPIKNMQQKIIRHKQSSKLATFPISIYFAMFAFICRRKFGRKRFS